MTSVPFHVFAADLAAPQQHQTRSGLSRHIPLCTLKIPFFARFAVHFAPAFGHALCVSQPRRQPLASLRLAAEMLTAHLDIQHGIPWNPRITSTLDFQQKTANNAATFLTSMSTSSICSLNRVFKSMQASRFLTADIKCHYLHEAVAKLDPAWMYHNVSR